MDFSCKILLTIIQFYNILKFLKTEKFDTISGYFLKNNSLTPHNMVTYKWLNNNVLILILHLRIKVIFFHGNKRFLEVNFLKKIYKRTENVTNVLEIYPQASIKFPSGQDYLWIFMSFHIGNRVFDNKKNLRIFTLWKIDKKFPKLTCSEVNVNRPITGGPWGKNKLNVKFIGIPTWFWYNQVKKSTSLFYRLENRIENRTEVSLVRVWNFALTYRQTDKNRFLL